MHAAERSLDVPQALPEIKARHEPPLGLVIHERLAPLGWLFGALPARRLESRLYSFGIRSPQKRADILTKWPQSLTPSYHIASC